MYLLYFGVGWEKGVEEIPSKYKELRILLAKKLLSTTERERKLMKQAGEKHLLRHSSFSLVFRIDNTKQTNNKKPVTWLHDQFSQLMVIVSRLCKLLLLLEKHAEVLCSEVEQEIYIETPGQHSKWSLDWTSYQSRFIFPSLSGCGQSTCGQSSQYMLSQGKGFYVSIGKRFLLMDEQLNQKPLIPTPLAFKVINKIDSIAPLIFGCKFTFFECWFVWSTFTCLWQLGGKLLQGSRN